MMKTQAVASTAHRLNDTEGEAGEMDTIMSPIVSAGANGTTDGAQAFTVVSEGLTICVNIRKKNHQLDAQGDVQEGSGQYDRWEALVLEHVRQMEGIKATAATALAMDVLLQLSASLVFTDNSGELFDDDRGATPVHVGDKLHWAHSFDRLLSAHKDLQQL